MNEIHKARLLKLADFLDNLPPERFDFISWVGGDWEGKADLSCGTTACAMGWATTIPEFGLSLVRKAISKVGFVCLTSRVDIAKEISMWSGSDTASEALIAGFQVFGLRKDEFNFLFIPETCPCLLSSNATAKEVADNIRNFVRDPSIVEKAIETFDEF